MKAWHEVAIALKVSNPGFTVDEIANIVDRSPDAVQKALRRAREHGQFEMPDDVRMSVTLGVTLEDAVNSALEMTADTLNDEQVPVAQRARVAVALLNGPLVAGSSE